ncbi:NCS2 family permease [Desulforamulus hydrothermalis]|uniref:Putative xanthine/uracil permease n=1 Tax=Desulforamulus hydrothermalis Lam5 = DSM 18033 TaxID=1121428 RepID=K8EL13_9FIRM|nr:NCS2 family permease [Desulforamulus hydrothermalis]CCO09221.1 putative xanthine/uracil permease [Desulforamulus hydrothermalis Lam5 = DSM 18033]SHH06217.1 putative MFS transporter, AGZA family, xanthine/uracil permease [Desulforamulus hydrothermalis Lam5 = DSM 18033]
MLEQFFKLKEHNTTVRTEIIAGLTTFMTMAYILFLNPNILAGTGMDKNAVFFATAMAAGVVTIAMGLFVNFPIALAPGMGLNAFFAAVAAQHVGMPWQVALGAVFISGIIFVILTVTKVRQILVVAVPNSLKRAITVGIGLFITIIGLKLSELTVVKAGPVIPPTLQALQDGGVATLKFFEWNIFLGSFHNPATLLTLIGLAVTSVLMANRVKGSLLIGILVSTLIGIPLGVTVIPENFSPFALPDFSNLNVGKLDIMGALHMGIWTVVFTFTFVELFDTFGTLVGTADKAGLLDKNGQSPRIGRAMLVDALGVSFGALMGTSTVTAYVESAAGIGEGGRTGLTAVTTGVLFLLALALAPLAGLIPSAATAPALIIVGVLMVSAVREIDFDDFTEGFPAFMTFTLMPFTYSIANGIAAGIIFYTALKVLSGRAKEVHWLMYILFVLVITRYIFLGGE